MEKRYVVGMGEALWDILPDGKKIGGAPANFAYHVSQFGLPGCVVSAVGPDENGRELLEILSDRGVNYMIEEVPFPTGTVDVALDADGIPHYDIRRHVAWDNIPFTPALEQLASCTHAVCFGSLAQRSEGSRATIRRFLDAMPVADDRLVVFDINLRQDFFSRDIVLDSIERCNVLKINDEELVVVSEMFSLDSSDVEQCCRRLVERFSLKALILTCGVNGSYIFSDQPTSFLPTPRVEVADTVGAGDSFTAAFVASLLKGYSIRKAHEKAVETSAYVCSQPGAMPVLPEKILDYGTV